MRDLVDELSLVSEEFFSFVVFFFFSSRRRHTRYWRDWSSDVCSSDLTFGWSGLLSEKKRDQAAEQLYDALQNLQLTLQEKHPHEIFAFEIYTHSHGGQLLAQLPIIKKQRKIGRASCRERV